MVVVVVFVAATAEGPPTVLPKMPEVNRASPKAGKVPVNDVAVFGTALLVLLPNDTTVVGTLLAVLMADKTPAAVDPAALVKEVESTDRPFKLLALPSLPTSGAPLEGTKKVPKLEMPVLNPFRPESDAAKDFPRFS